MTFGEKLKSARLALNLSQVELAEIVDISERSLYSYEQTGVLPKSTTLKKIADALGVTVAYFMDEDESAVHADIDQDLLANIKSEFGSKGVREARDVVARASALFAGGDLDDESKDLFFQSLLEVYMDSKREAREKFSSKRKASRKKQ